jgi:hypothetical protein
MMKIMQMTKIMMEMKIMMKMKTDREQKAIAKAPITAPNAHRRSLQALMLCEVCQGTSRRGRKTFKLKTKTRRRRRSMTKKKNTNDLFFN